jgi:hypothetical protein
MGISNEGRMDGVVGVAVGKIIVGKIYGGSEDL